LLPEGRYAPCTLADVHLRGRSAGKTGNLVEMDRPQRDRGEGAGPLSMMTDRGMIHAT
jgi:hypothetical protein